MARIKYVINERRLAYEGAVKIHEERRQELLEKQARIGAPSGELAESKAAGEELASDGEKEKQPETAPLLSSYPAPPLGQQPPNLSCRESPTSIHKYQETHN